MTNNKLKYELFFHSNGSKWFEQYYDEKGRYHNENGPDFQIWYENGFLYEKTFYIHGNNHNINCPASIWFSKNGKIENKNYYIDGLAYNKLDWQNKIKNV